MEAGFPRVGWGCSDIFMHTLARVIFFGFKILNSIFVLVFRKNVFGGYEDFLGVITNWTILSGHFYAF